MSKSRDKLSIDIIEVLDLLGKSGIAVVRDASTRSQLLDAELVYCGDSPSTVVATNNFFKLGTANESIFAVRRILSMDREYRQLFLLQLIPAIMGLSDDRSLADTLERLEHLSAELLDCLRNPKKPNAKLRDKHQVWHVAVWQSPDAITLLSKVVERPQDFPSLPIGPVVPVGFDWLSWETPPLDPAPAPWADAAALESTFATTEHPFWGAMVATLDACTGDYDWQSLILRSDLLRSQHRTLGDAETVLESLWRRELGLYPVPPLVMDADMEKLEARPAASAVGSRSGIRLFWLRRSLDLMAQQGIAILSEGSWRLTDAFRTELMKDDKHMMVFEQLRRRSFRLASAAETWSPVSRPAEMIAAISREVKKRETSAS